MLRTWPAGKDGGARLRMPCRLLRQPGGRRGRILGPRGAPRLRQLPGRHTLPAGGERGGEAWWGRPGGGAA